MDYYQIKEVVPDFLKDWQDKIFTAGKCVNILKYCDPGRIEKRLLPEIIENEEYFDKKRLFDEINTAFWNSNIELVKYLFEERDLLQKLKSIKTFYFMNRSDFYTNYLDLASEELDKPVHEISITKLQNFFELSQRAASIKHLKYNDNFSIEMETQSLVDHLFKNRRLSKRTSGNLNSSIDSLSTLSNFNSPRHSISNFDLSDGFASIKPKNTFIKGLEALSLDVRFDFPTSIVINPTALTKYKLIFRHLTQMKNIELRLGHTLVEQSKLRRIIPLSIGGGHLNYSWISHMHSLRNRMLNFVKNVLYFVSLEVIEPNWAQFLKKLEIVKTVDEILSIHENFLNITLNLSMLRHHQLLTVCSKLLQACRAFIKLSKALTIKHEENKQTPDSSFDYNSQTIKAELNKLHNSFHYHMKLFISSLQKHSTKYSIPEFLYLVEKLDYNAYYQGLDVKVLPPKSQYNTTSGRHSKSNSLYSSPFIL